MCELGPVCTDVYAFFAGVAVVILAKRAPAGRSTREMAPLPNGFVL